MRRPGSLLVICLLSTGLVRAADDEPPRAEYGPQVTLDADGQPLAEVLDQLGRQINRRFIGGLLASPARAKQPTTLHLHQATVRDTLEAIEDVTGYRVTRQGRFRYTLDSPRTVVGRTGVALGDWVVWLTMLRYTFFSYVYPGDLDKTVVRAYLTPQFNVEAPNDVEALRIRRVDCPTAETDQGERLEPIYNTLALTEPYNSDPRIWLVAQQIKTPELPATELSHLWFGITYAARLEQHVFDFGLGGQDQREPTLTDGDYDATLSTSRSARQPGWAVTITGPVPESLADRRAQQLLRRDLWVEGRLYSAEGQPLYTEATLANTTVADTTWTSQWRFTSAEPAGSELVPARLEVRLYVPGPDGPTVTVRFEGLPIPPRKEDQEGL